MNISTLFSGHKTIFFTALLFPGMSQLTAAEQAHHSTGITTRPFGECSEGNVHLYTLTNLHGLSVSIMDYGATVVKVITPDRQGHFDDIALGFDSPTTYAQAKLNFGTMGRYINRIAHGQIKLDGKVYPLTKNKGTATMHGGNLGFNRHLWKAQIVRENPPTLALTRLSPDGEEGFPGNLNTTVTFTLGNDDHWRLNYTATTDKPTVINLSNHTLFNLSGAGHGTILEDIATVNADAFTVIDQNSIPTGEIREVANTAWDLREPTLIKTRLKDFGNNPPGYDFNYVLNKSWFSSLSLAGEVYDPKSGRYLRVLTDQPGVQFYTGNFFDGTLIGKGGLAYNAYCAFSLEAQHFPDSPNHPNFPSTVLRPGTTYHAAIEYIFGTR